MRLLVQTPYLMQTSKLQMAQQRRRPSLALQIIMASNYKGSPPLTAWIKPQARWSRMAIRTTWAQGMDEADTCEVLALEAVVVDIGAEYLVRISPRWRLKILALRARRQHRGPCDKGYQTLVFCGNADSMSMEKDQLAVVRRHSLKGKPNTQSSAKNDCRTNSSAGEILRLLRTLRAHDLPRKLHLKSSA